MYQSVKVQKQSNDSFVEVIHHTNSVVEQSMQKLGIEEENKSLVQDFE